MSEILKSNPIICEKYNKPMKLVKIKRKNWVGEKNEMRSMWSN